MRLVPRRRKDMVAWAVKNFKTWPKPHEMPDADPAEIWCELVVLNQHHLPVLRCNLGGGYVDSTTWFYAKGNPKNDPDTTTMDGEHVNAEILRAIADGKKVQYRDVESGEDWVRNGPWKDFDANSIEACWNLLASGKHQWRIAPKTIKIGDFEVPEPCREAPKVGQEFCAVNPFSGPQWFTWTGSGEDLHALESGFVHLTKEAAEMHYEAFKNLLAKK